MGTITRRRLRFTGPEQVDVISEPAPEPSPDEVGVRTLYSAISPGTERLVYQGQTPADMAADASIEALGGDLSYPLSYGYACVGEVDRVGGAVSEEWLGTRVFAFQPHVSRFVAAPSSLVQLPNDVDGRDAVMIPSLETAVNLVMDGRPLIGENVLLFGQGVVGLLTTSLLSDFPLSTLAAVEPTAARRTLSAKMGAQALESVSEVTEIRWSPAPRTSDPISSGAADLVFELSGQPQVLNDAIEHTCFDGRIIVGSWYGTKTAALELGEAFHRSRMEIVSSQVSTIDPSFRGRWTKSRRMSYVLDSIGEVSPSQLITDEFDLDSAPDAYSRLATDPSMIQPIFVYS